MKKLVGNSIELPLVANGSWLPLEGVERFALFDAGAGRVGSAPN